jgi:isopentenyl diphosphate isomerase/L-lactate dehydrogenase-like FMN-dependent dehydrogenase
MSALSDCYNIADFREAARRHLPRGVFEFVDRGSEDEVALAANRQAFERLKLLTKFCVDLTDRDMGTELFGRRISLPLAIAPTGIAGLCWYQGELALAKAAAAAGVPFTLATSSLTPMEMIAKEVKGRRWFQLYLWKDEESSFEIVSRAQNLDYEVLIVTIDTALGRGREYNDRNGFTDPISLNRKMLTDLALHPRWLLGVMGRYIMTTGMPRHENFPAKYQRRITRGTSSMPMNHPGLNWQHIRRLREMWKGPMVIKGVLNEIDARLALENGADGIVVSNHGGRALDSAVPTIEILPNIVKAVGGRTTILLDGGIRRGSDIVKAVALGANAVLIGRATLYAIATAGQEGAEKALKILATEFEKNMAYIGARRISELGPDVFSPATMRLLGYETSR